MAGKRVMACCRVGGHEIDWVLGSTREFHPMRCSFCHISEQIFKIRHQRSEDKRRRQIHTNTERGMARERGSKSKRFKTRAGPISGSMQNEPTLSA